MYHQVTLEVISEKDRYGIDSVFLVLDIDHFKQVNDTYGHNSGDSVLKKLADLIKSRQRKEDKVFRIGGEEFCIILKHLTKESAESTAEEIRLLVEKKVFIQSESVTVSIGATMVQAKDTPDSVMKRADKALYRAKNNGRNQVVFIENYSG